MSREFCVNRLDITTNGNIINKNDGFVCGRDDFTGALASWFCNRNAQWMILTLKDEDKQILTKFSSTQEVKDDDEPKYLMGVINKDPNLDLDDNNIKYFISSYESFEELCKEYISEDNTNIERAKDTLYDARRARCNCFNYEEFVKFSDLVDSLHDYLDSYLERASDFKREVDRIKEEVMHYGSSDLIASFILILYSE